MKLSEYIKKYRKENNLTQLEFAEKLFVSKQAVSKWENDKGLPDISLFPTLADLLGVSVDELMGKEVKKAEENKDEFIYKKKIKKLMRVLIISIFSFVIIIAVFLLNINNIYKYKVIKETERNLDINLPKVEEFQSQEYNAWIGFGNYFLPTELTQLVFKVKLNIQDETWMNNVNDELLDSLPALALYFIDDCDYFKIINLDTKEINKIDTSEKHKYAIYFLQLDNNRIIIMEFEA